MLSTRQSTQGNRERAEDEAESADIEVGNIFTLDGGEIAQNCEDSKARHE